MYILKVHTRGSIRVAKFLAGSLSSSRGGNFKILRLKIAIFENFSNHCIWPTKSITTMKFGLRACFNLKFIRVVQKMRFWKFILLKYRSAFDIDVPPKVTLPPRDRTIFLHPSNHLGIGKDISKNWRLYIFCLGEKWKNVFF